MPAGGRWAAAYDTGTTPPLSATRSPLMSDSVPVGGAPDVWENAGPTVPNSARMYDYYLGGKDNFPVDREAAEKAVPAMPTLPVLARANRAFLVDAVARMAAAGIGQFLDVGSGLPTSPNVHEV